MRDRKYLLTISIMTSNRKDTLPKTLESIRPLLDNVSSELIITDTGCDEDLLEFIRRYTDKIVKFEWCKDFAKARNVGLKLAQGKWFMYLDDDEWFEDVNPIIDFFNSGESEKYNQFYYIQRNYRNKSGTLWQDAYVDRGMRLSEGIQFEDVIHENYSCSFKPVKMINAYVHHYGYVFETKEAQLAHSRRNLELLERMWKEGNHTPRHYIHLLQEYNMLEQHETAYKVALLGIEKANQNGISSRRLLGCIKANAIYSLYHLGRYDEMIKSGREYLREGNLTLAAGCAINGYLVQALYRLGDMRGVLMAAEEYYGLSKYLQDREEQTKYDSLLEVGNALSGIVADNIRHIVNECIRAIEKNVEQKGDSNE